MHESPAYKQNQKSLSYINAGCYSRLSTVELRSATVEPRSRSTNASALVQSLSL